MSAAASGKGLPACALHERVSRYLEFQPEPVSQNRVVGDVRGKAKRVREALDWLVTVGYATETKGPRKGLRDSGRSLKTPGKRQSVRPRCAASSRCRPVSGSAGSLTKTPTCGRS